MDAIDRFVIDAKAPAFAVRLRTCEEISCKQVESMESLNDEVQGTKWGNVALAISAGKCCLQAS